MWKTFVHGPYVGVNDEQNKSIAVMTNHTKEVRIANAYKMAAAEDLIRVLKRLVECAESGTAVYSGDAVWDEARSALELVKGGGE